LNIAKQQILHLILIAFKKLWSLIVHVHNVVEKEGKTEIKHHLKILPEEVEIWEIKIK